jgi:hypothetical protein
VATRYRIYAYSQRLNQKQQQMHLIESNDALLTDANYANQVAQSYANSLNANFFNHTNDWAPSIEAYEYQPNTQAFSLPGSPTMG